MGKTVRESLELPAGFKLCPDCKIVKMFDAFPRNKRTKSGLATYCKPCHNARGKKSISRLYGSERHYHLKRRYGIGAAEVEALIEAQGGVCAICQEAPPAHVDHDHATGAVRGVLCFNCNGGLGQFRDRTDVMRKAIEYLEDTA